jgi:hypothetical protein
LEADLILLLVVVVAVVVLALLLVRNHSTASHTRLVLPHPLPPVIMIGDADGVIIEDVVLELVLASE